MPTTETKPRKQFMKWLKLGEGKDPEFEKIVFLYDEKAKEGENLNIGCLTSKAVKASGIKYGFITPASQENDEDPEETRFTHYCNPVLPK